jgi:hypothetical protein
MNGAKLDWKKSEKAFYLPGTEPEALTIPAFKFFSIHGQGNPNSSAFQEYVGVLYSLSYAVRMSYKGPEVPGGYIEYTVYPLEGVWDITEEAKASARAVGSAAARGTLDKDSLVFHLMIRQPDFVAPEFARSIVETVRRKKPHPLLDSVEFGAIDEGPSVQLLHLGSYDAEPASFARMEAFCAANSLSRKSKLHREIYLSDPRRTDAAKMRTVLRFQVTRVP